MSEAATKLADALDFERVAERFVDWCRDDALPFWMSVGVDEDGSFHERLNEAGLPDSESPRRVRVQCRQIYVFAHAHHLGWISNGKEICDRATTRLIQRAAQYDSVYKFDGLVNVLTPDGEVSDPTRDLYTHAFFLFALAWRARAFSDEKSVDLADDTLNFLDRRMKAETGGWFESLPPALPRRQNPHMHLFEAFLALYEATSEPRFLERAHDMAELFEARFFDRSTGNLFEYFTGDWSHDPQTGHIIEPGHLMEWCWLMIQYGRAAGRDCLPMARKLYRRALAVGQDASTSLIIDRVHKDGTPIWKRRRLWPQTELIKAAIVMDEEGEPGALDLAATAISRLMETYLNTPIPGLWRDRYEASGASIPGPAPASSFYHLFLAVTESQKRCQAPTSGSA